MKSFRLLITCLWAVSMTLAACAPTPTPFPLSPLNPQPTDTVIPPTLTAAPSSTFTVTPAPTASITPTVPPTRASTASLTPTVTRTAWPIDAPGLGSLAKKQGLYIGAAVEASLLAEETAYQETILKEFNILAPEQEMSMCVVWPERETWNFEASDALVKFAQANKIRTRGPSLVGTDCIPDWITEGEFTPVEASDILKKYISTVVGRYRGKVAYWDVVNNTLEAQPIWATLIGPIYIERAFEWAHAADPRAKLFYSDHSAEVMNKKSDLQYDFLRNLQYKNVPVNGLGMQMHLNASIQKESVAENIERINALGLEVHITHFGIAPIAGAAYADELQAMVYEDMLTVCLNARNCPVFMMWGFTDKYIHPDQPDADALIFDDHYQPKPAYEALYKALQ